MHCCCSFQVYFIAVRQQGTEVVSTERDLQHQSMEVSDGQGHEDHLFVSTHTMLLDSADLPEVMRKTQVIFLRQMRLLGCHQQGTLLHSLCMTSVLHSSSPSLQVSHVYQIYKVSTSIIPTEHT